MSEYGKHKLSRAVLYSATILRKAIEDEDDAEHFSKKHDYSFSENKLKNSTIAATKYPYNGEKDCIIKGELCAENYGKGQVVNPTVKEVCNWLLHSYVWDVVGYSHQKGYAGFLIVSDYDKEKFLHFVSFDDWQKTLTAVIEKGAF